MIVDLVVTAVCAILTWLLTLIPEWDLPGFGQASTVTVSQYVATADAFLPLEAMAAVFGLGLTFAAGMWLWHLFTKIWALLPIPK